MKVFGSFETRKGGREYQEDAVIVRSGPQQATALAVVADGVGGHAGGRVASQVIARLAADAWERVGRNPPDPKAFLGRIVSDAHHAIKQEGLRLGSAPQSTIAMAMVADGKAHFVHVGDSRIYLVRGGIVEFVTRDHSVVEGLFHLGQITEQEKATHPRRSELLQSVGGSRDPTLSYDVRDLMDGDRVVICSDGVWEALRKDEWPRLLQDRDPAQSAERIVDLAVRRANNQGDNATLAVLRVEMEQVPLERLKPVRTPPVAAAKERLNEVVSAAPHVLRSQAKYLRWGGLTVGLVMLGVLLGSGWLYPWRTADKGTAQDQPQAVVVKAPALPAARPATSKVDERPATKVTAANPQPKPGGKVEMELGRKPLDEIELEAEPELLLTGASSPSSPRDKALDSVVAVMKGGLARVWVRNDKIERLPLEVGRGTGRARSTVIDRQGRLLATTNDKMELIVWSLNDRQERSRVILPGRTINGVVSDSDYSFAAATDGSNLVWNWYDLNSLAPEDKKWRTTIVEPKNIRRGAPPMGLGRDTVADVSSPSSVEEICLREPNSSRCEAAQEARRTAEALRREKASKSNATKGRQVQLPAETFNIRALVPLPSHGILGLLVTNSKGEPELSFAVRSDTDKETFVYITQSLGREMFEAAGIKDMSNLLNAKLFALDSPNEPRVAIWPQDERKAVYLAEAKTLQLTKWVEVPADIDERITAVAPAPDQGLVVGTVGGSVLRFDANGRLVRAFKASDQPILAVASNLRSGEVYSADETRVMKVWSRD